MQIKLALHNKSKDIDLVMMEEPENHLSHVELSKLVQDIEDQRDKQAAFPDHPQFLCTEQTEHQ